MFLIIILHARILPGDFGNGECSGKLVKSGIEGGEGKKRGDEKKWAGVMEMRRLRRGLDSKEGFSRLGFRVFWLIRLQFVWLWNFW